MTEQLDSQDEGPLLLIDPAFEETDEMPDPPPEAIVGGWEVTVDGSRGRFRPNPVHVPSSPEVPSDPVDAVLRLIVIGEADVEDLVAVLGEIDLGLAVGADANLVLADAPDGVPCLLATTAPRHRPAVEGAPGRPVAGWYEATLAKVAAALPEETLPGERVDVLLNPRGPAPLRVTAATLREATQRSPDQAP